MSRRADAGAELALQIERNIRLAECLDAPDFDLEALLRLQQWQRRRLARTYADLHAQTRYRAACEFFLDELYGGLDFRQRDVQLRRVVPVMRRILPAHLVHAVAEAMALQAVSLEFDFELAHLLADTPRIDQAAYARAYREQNRFDQRREQIEMIRRLGELLDATVSRPLVNRLVRMLRGPARRAGFGALQDFLERGLAAFAHMRGADEFIATVHHRERVALERIAAGDPAPFAV